MRRALPAVLAVLLALAAAGCSTSSKAEVVPVRDVAPTKAQALAAAKGINLVAADLPLYRGKRSKETARERFYDAKLQRCLGLPSKRKDIVAELDSLEFSKGTRAVGSSVTVYSTTAAADADVALLEAVRGADCLGSTLTQMFRERWGKDGVTVGAARLQKATSALPGAEGLRGYDITIPLSGPRGQATVEASVLAFAVKHTEVLLTVIDVNEPFPRDQREGLISTLLRNAETKGV